MNSDLCYLSAVEALALFRARKLSPVELMQALIDRAGQVEPALNAFSYRFFEDALKAARQAENRYIKDRAYPLDGIAVAFKDESFIKGQITSNGSLLMKDYVAESTSLIVERLLDVGAIVHARTTTPEFSINGSPVEPTLGWVMTYPFNMLSRCPVRAVPSGRAANNVPTGIQIVGRPYDDLSVFQAAANYENAVGPLFDVRNRPAFGA